MVHLSSQVVPCLSTTARPGPWFFFCWLSRHSNDRAFARKFLVGKRIKNPHCPVVTRRTGHEAEERQRGVGLALFVKCLLSVLCVGVILLPVLPRRSGTTSAFSRRNCLSDVKSLATRERQCTGVPEIIWKWWCLPGMIDIVSLLGWEGLSTGPEEFRISTDFNGYRLLQIVDNWDPTNLLQFPVTLASGRLQSAEGSGEAPQDYPSSRTPSVQREKPRLQPSSQIITRPHGSCFRGGDMSGADSVFGDMSRYFERLCCFPFSESVGTVNCWDEHNSIEKCCSVANRLFGKIKNDDPPGFLLDPIPDRRQNKEWRELAIPEMMAETWNNGAKTGIARSPYWQITGKNSAKSGALSVTELVGCGSNNDTKENSWSSSATNIENKCKAALSTRGEGSFARDFIRSKGDYSAGKGDSPVVGSDMMQEQVSSSSSADNHSVVLEEPTEQQVDLDPGQGQCLRGCNLDFVITSWIKVNSALFYDRYHRAVAAWKTKQHNDKYSAAGKNETGRSAGRTVGSTTDEVHSKNHEEDVTVPEDHGVGGRTNIDGHAAPESTFFESSAFGLLLRLFGGEDPRITRSMNGLHVQRSPDDGYDHHDGSSSGGVHPGDSETAVGGEDSSARGEWVNGNAFTNQLVEETFEAIREHGEGIGSFAENLQKTTAKQQPCILGRLLAFFYSSRHMMVKDFVEMTTLPLPTSQSPNNNNPDHANTDDHAEAKIGSEPPLATTTLLRPSTYDAVQQVTAEALRYLNMCDLSEEVMFEVTGTTASHMRWVIASMDPESRLAASVVVSNDNNFQNHDSPSSTSLPSTKQQLASDSSSNVDLRPLIAENSFSNTRKAVIDFGSAGGLDALWAAALGYDVISVEGDQRRKRLIQKRLKRLQPHSRHLQADQNLLEKVVGSLGGSSTSDSPSDDPSPTQFAPNNTFIGFQGRENSPQQPQSTSRRRPHRVDLSGSSSSSSGDTQDQLDTSVGTPSSESLTTDDTPVVFGNPVVTSARFGNHIIMADRYIKPGFNNMTFDVRDGLSGVETDEDLSEAVSCHEVLRTAADLGWDVEAVKIDLEGMDHACFKSILWNTHKAANTYKEAVTVVHSEGKREMENDHVVANKNRLLPYRLPQFISVEVFDSSTTLAIMRLGRIHGYTHWKLVEQGGYWRSVSWPALRGGDGTFGLPSPLDISTTFGEILEQGQRYIWSESGSGPLGDQAVDWLVGPKWREIRLHQKDVQNDYLPVLWELQIAHPTEWRKQHSKHQENASPSSESEMTVVEHFRRFLHQHDRSRSVRFDLHMRRADEED